MTDCKICEMPMPPGDFADVCEGCDRELNPSDNEPADALAVKLRRIEGLAFYLNPSQEQDLLNMTEIRRILRPPTSGLASR